ncbi:uncharacterized protein LOC103719439 isoform X2 [Phoenix dactylifera]|uniref:Uncharacterized protein LOC103719439 isoform X2 n=1 Tax=Phoenix dactylifera TaxID=42345 RepID=A0A8B7CUV7_PHODC|nr:uncharacterized protein LOC103719439 isoform X2 [Phoenix dactylifera]
MAKLSYLLLVLLVFVSVASSNEALYHRKIRSAMNEGLKHHQVEDLTATIRHHLLENPNGGRNSGLNEAARDPTSRDEGIDNTVDQEGDPFDATRNGNKSEYRGAGTDSHHSIDLESWNKLHPAKPAN